MDTYQTLQIIKKSEKSEVYLILDIEENQKYILKKVYNGAPIYSVLQFMKSRYIPKVCDFVEDGLEAWIIEEYIEGITLEELLLDIGKLSIRQTKEYILQVCSALNELHKKGIIHRDIKPSNILLKDDDSIKLIDFDAARFIKENVQKDTKYLGTEGYAPPEQYGFGQTDFRTDIYALGITMKEMLGEDGKYGYLDKIIKKCTKKDPNDRFSTVNEVKSAVQRKKQMIQCILGGIGVLIMLGGICIFYRNLQETSNFQTKTMQVFDVEDANISQDGAAVLLKEEDIVKLYCKAMEKKNELYKWCDRSDISTILNGEEYYMLSEKYNTWDRVREFFSDTWSSESVESMVSELSDNFIEKDGKLYTLDADGGSILEYENALVLRRKNNGTNLEVILSVPGGDSTPFRIRVQAVYEDAVWKIDSDEDMLEYTIEDDDLCYDGYSYYNTDCQVGFYYPLRFFDEKEERKNEITLSSLEGYRMRFVVYDRGKDQTLEDYYLKYKNKNLIVDEKEDNLFFISYIENGIWNQISVAENQDMFYCIEMKTEEERLEVIYPGFKEIIGSFYGGGRNPLIAKGDADFFN